jgi:hypothetical protein
MFTSPKENLECIRERKKEKGKFLKFWILKIFKKLKIYFQNKNKFFKNQRGEIHRTKKNGVRGVFWI